MAQRALAVPWEDAAGRQWEVKIRRLCLSRADPAGSTRLCFLYPFQQFINFTAKQSHLFEGEVSYSKSLLGRKQQMILTRRGCLKGCRCYCPGGALLGPRAPRAHPASPPTANSPPPQYAAGPKNATTPPSSSGCSGRDTTAPPTGAELMGGGGSTHSAPAAPMGIGNHNLWMRKNALERLLLC